MEKEDSMQEQTGNVSRKMETLRQTEEEIPEMKKHGNRNEEGFLWAHQKTGGHG